MRAAVLGGHLAVCKLLVEHGAIIEQTNGLALLHLAAEKNKLKVVKWLLEKGANDKDVEVALTIAREKEYEALVNYLEPFI